MIQKIKCWLGFHEFSTQWFKVPPLMILMFDKKCNFCGSHEVSKSDSKQSIKVWGR